MKVQNTAIFMGDNTRRERNNGVQEEKSEKSNVYAGNLNKAFDPIAKKKQDAQKQAMKVIGDAWAGDRKVDDDLASRRDKMREYKEIIGRNNEELKRIGEERLALRDQYGVGADSQEEKDLRLLEKAADSFKPDAVQLTKEEQQRLREIEEAGGPTEYQKRSLDMRASGSTFQKEIDEAKKGIEAENHAIYNLKETQLKSQSMLKASNAAEDILEAASEEVFGMLIEEAKDHVDEEMEEKKEEAAEKAEKEKEEEEKIEKRKEEKEEKEEFAEEAAEAATEFMVEAENTMEDVQKEIKKIMDKMKLVEEDIKGAAVDTLM